MGTNAVKKINNSLWEIESQGLIKALNRAQAVIEFDLDGTIITANENFLNTVGYTLEELKGKHHRMFCDESFANSFEYKDFWRKLGSGEFEAGEFKRFNKAGEEVWINASYNPIFDENGKPYKVVKFATNITETKLKNAEFEGKIAAISKSQAVIEFNLDGTILTANENFLLTLGYDLNEIEGKHHRMFCDTEYTSSKDYENFWKRLSAGEFEAGEYKRKAKDGSDIWINASYNPILDSEGRPFKIVKFATNITESKLKNADFEGKISAISKAQAMIEFHLDGTIITANDNFLGAVGYSLNEIEGNHHRMFCETEYANSTEYKLFWERLAAGEFQAGEFKRKNKHGEDIWINASYNPILDSEGNPFKVVKFATDITESKIRNSDFESQLNAIDKSQAVIEFKPDGTILKANQNFLSCLGYSMHEIKDKHHRMFCEAELATSQEYQDFWHKLSQGEFQAGEYKRIGQGGKEIWINASYNPIFDLDGNVYKVVKYATDLTKEKEAYNNLVQTFESAAINLATIAEQIHANANGMNQDSEKTLEMSNQAALDSKEVSDGVQSVSTSTEQMTASIQELSKASSEASNLSKEASSKAEEASLTINDLGKASEDIGNVIKVINSIAQQTNLLALNATIEAARAGDAGKGFAVVASEVKELAKQTAAATEDISSKINNVQESTQSAVLGVSEVTTRINQLDEIASRTASAVEEQSATTNGVSKILQEQNAAVNNISSLINNVADAASKSSNGAQETLGAASKLNDLSRELRVLVEEAKTA